MGSHRRAPARAAALVIAIAAVGVSATAGSAAVLASAAAAGNRIGVTGPKTNVLGTNFNETVSGHATGSANYVVSGEQLNKGAGCAASYKHEKTRSDFYRWPTGTGAVHGSFSLVAAFGAAHAGTHGICSYLINRSTGQTYAHASLFWTNKAATTTPPTGGKLLPAPVGMGQCQAQGYPDGSTTAQIAIEGATCAVATTVEGGAPAAKGMPYTNDGFSCTATAEGPGSTWSSAWGGTYYAYTCVAGSEQVAFTWGTDYTYSG